MLRERNLSITFKRHNVRFCHNVFTSRKLHNCMLGIYFNFKLQNPRGQCARYVKKGVKRIPKISELPWTCTWNVVCIKISQIIVFKICLTASEIVKRMRRKSNKIKHCAVRSQRRKWLFCFAYGDFLVQFLFNVFQIVFGLRVIIKYVLGNWFGACLLGGTEKA